MKSASLILRIVAIVGAVAAIALWFMVKGQIKQATIDMQGVEGTLLLEKSAKVPGILAEKDQLTKDLKKANLDIKDLKNVNAKLDADLKAENANNIALNKDNLKLRGDLRKVNADLQDAKDTIAKKDAIQKQLEKELVAAKNMQVDTSELDNLKAKLTTLNNQYQDLQKKYDVAAEKARLLELAEVIVVEDIDKEAGKKTTITKYFPPYVATGVMATITKSELADDLFSLNRGKKDQLGLRQKIDLKRDGKFVAQATVVEIADEMAVIAVNPKRGIPETIETGDILELVPTVDLTKKDEAKAEAKDEKAPAAEEK